MIVVTGGILVGKSDISGGCLSQIGSAVRLVLGYVDLKIAYFDLGLFGA
jgi:hypothetical protein